MFAHSEFLCHLAHDVKKLFTVRGKLAVSSDLSPNLSDTQKTASLESTRKINLKFGLHKNIASVEKHIVFHLVSVYASQKQSFQDQGVAGSTVILPLPLIQEGQMSVSGESMCARYWLTA